MKLLLHTCCTPCAIYPVKTAKIDRYDEITGLFYNPNIHPSQEFLKRLNQARHYFKSTGLELVTTNCHPKEYFSAVDNYDDPQKRCPACWEQRLAKTALFSKENGFDAFTTTLLGSPYQDHDIIKNICSVLETKTGIKFYYRDFRLGFKESHAEARQTGMYCQNYCGCIFSVLEREERRKARKTVSNDC